MPGIDSAKAWYPASDPVHGFDHILRVYRMAERLAQAEGADLGIVRAAALLHDAQSPTYDPESSRGDHHLASAEFAGQLLRKEGWPAGRIAAVQHCIRAHRFRDDREQPQSLEAQILFDADKLDAIGAIGVARAIAYAAMAGQPTYAQPTEQFLRTGTTEPGEAHSAYHEYLFKLRKLKDRLYTPSAQAIAAERHQYMVEFFARMGDEMDGDS